MIRQGFPAIALLLAACAAPMATRQTEPVTVGIVAINDFHGSLEPPGQSVLVPDGNGSTIGVPAGGAAWLASAIDGIRARYAHHVTVSAGDLIGASQIASSLFLDEPTIGVMNRIGLEFNAVGNHEFDRGREELLRMQSGGCARHTRRAPCRLERFGGAAFRFLAANAFAEDGRTVFPATAVKRFGNGRRAVVVGFVGLTLQGTSQLVSRDRIKGLAFGDEAAAINAAVPALKAQGADAVVVLIHQGGRTAPNSDPNGCDGFAGEIEPIVARLDPRVDVIVSGHTHAAYVCDYATRHPGRPLLLTSAGVYGGLVTDITLRIDPATSSVIDRKARNVVVQSRPYVAARGPVGNTDVVPRFTPRADVQAYVGRYVEAAREFAQRPVGRLAGPAERGAGGVALGGSLGNLVADAQLAATRGAGAQIALMNPFGLRAPLVPGADGGITFGQIHATSPFANDLVTQTLTGAELKAVLEQSFADSGREQLLSPSAGFAYTIDRTAAPGARIVAMTLAGEPIDPAARYRVTTSSFLANGGDGFSALARQRAAVTGGADIDALEAWLNVTPPRPVPSDARIVDATR